MKTKLIFLLTLLTTTCFAQSKLAGFVTEQNSGKRPVANAMIKSVGANPIASSNDGKFILTFQNLPAGKSIYVRAEKDGWEAVNEKELNTFIPASLDEKPLKIIVCEAGKLAKAKSKYYDTFELNLQNELAKQKAQNKGNEKQIAKLEEEFAKIQEQLNDLADEYSRINLDDASEKELKAIRLFNEGKYKEFMELKNSIVTEAQVDKAINNKGAGNKQIADGKAKVANSDSTIALYFKSQGDIAKTQILQFDFRGAEETYERIVTKDTANYDNIFNLAYFLAKQNQHDKAILYCQKAFKLAKTEYNVATTQNNLGMLYRAKNEYDAALVASQKALEIYERLAKINPASYESDVAMTLNNLGILYQDKNNYDAAFNALSKALIIDERFAKTNPAGFDMDFCRSIVLLCLLQKTDFQAHRQSQIDEYLGKAKIILLKPKYETLPLAKGLLGYVNDLEEYFKTKNNP